MSIGRRWRIVYLIIIELAQKYTWALVGGFAVGLSATLAVTRFYPRFIQFWLTPSDRIGIIGEFTPNNLPLSIQREISQGLTTIAPDGSVLPGLATMWEATDSGKTYIFYLRNDLKWHNKKTVLASDINYNIKNVTFTIVDDTTLKVTLDNAYSPFPSLVSKPLFQSGLLGFGEYRVGSIRLNANIVTYLKLMPVSRNQSEVHVREYHFYPTETAAVLAYKLGEIDTVMDLTSVGDLRSWRNTQIVELINYNHIVSVFFNVKEKMLQDKAARQALAYGIPMFPGERANSPITSTSWAYTDKIKKYTYDPGQTKKFFASIKNATESSSLTIATFPLFADEAQQIADSWTSLGIASEVRVVGNIPTDYQVLLSVQEVPPDPDQYHFWHSTQRATNKTGLTNVKIDKLLEDGRQESDPAVRKKIYSDFQRYLVEEAPAIFLHYQTHYTVRRK